MGLVNKDALKPEEHAILHELKGTLDALEIDVPAGMPHKIGNREVTFILPEYALVTRAEGTLGGGLDKTKPKELSLTLNALLLALKRAAVTVPESVWAESVREDLDGTKVEPPPEALAGLAIVQAERPGEPGERKTPAKRTGEKEVEIKIKRLPKSAVA